MAGPRRLSRLLPWLIGIAIVVVAGLAGALGQRYSASFDWTAGNRNTLTPASQQVLAALSPGPIVFTAYVPPGSARADIRERLARYRRAADNVRLVFRDPATHPAAVRRLGIGEDGAVVVAHAGREATLTDYDEPSITHALQRISPGGNPWVVFVTGHGERDPNAGDRAGYQRIARALDAQGLRTRTLNLASAGAVPRNTGLLVIASPQSAYLPGEVTMITDYLARGGNLLWLDDPGPRYGLTPLAAALGVHWLSGTLVYPDYKQLGTKSPAISVIANYPDTPITRDLKRLTVFPLAGALQTSAGDDHNGWQPRAILRSATRSWLETQPLDGAHSITFQPDQGDRRGPLAIGLMDTRPAPAGADTPDDERGPQRAAVIADSDFMDNGHLETLGNRALALALFQWGVGRDDQIAVDVPDAPDDRLAMRASTVGDLRWLYVVVLPGLLVAIGALRWLVRRRR